MKIFRRGKSELDRLAPSASVMHSEMGRFVIGYLITAAIALPLTWSAPAHTWQSFVAGAIIGAAVPTLACAFWWWMLLLIFAED